MSGSNFRPEGRADLMPQVLTGAIGAVERRCAIDDVLGLRLSQCFAAGYRQKDAVTVNLK